MTRTSWPTGTTGATLATPAAGGREDSVVSPLADSDERAIEGALRPKRLDDFVGQHRVREQLTLLLRSALRRGRPPDHVLLSGPPGLGKTTIAMIIAAAARRAAADHQRPGDRALGDLAAVSPPCRRATASSSTRSTGWPARPRRCSTWR